MIYQTLMFAISNSKSSVKYFDLFEICMALWNRGIQRLIVEVSPWKEFRKEIIFQIILKNHVLIPEELFQWFPDNFVKANPDKCDICSINCEMQKF